MFQSGVDIIIMASLRPVMLLMRNALVAGDQNVETGFLRCLEQFAIFDAGPVQVSDRHDIMLWQESPKPMGDVFITEYAHRLRR